MYWYKTTAWAGLSYRCIVLGYCYKSAAYLCTESTYYRVAQNKMCHLTKCNFSTASSDFSFKISGSKDGRFFNLGKLKVIAVLMFCAIFKMHVGERINSYFLLNFYREHCSIFVTLKYLRRLFILERRKKALNVTLKLCYQDLL